jgi:hypothetical protein
VTCTWFFTIFIPLIPLYSLTEMSKLPSFKKDPNLT